MAALLVLLGAAPALAQKPVWTPIAELLVGSIGEADPVRMSTVMTRCTALNVMFAELASDMSAEKSQHFKDEALRHIQRSIHIESKLVKASTGQDADAEVLSGSILEKVKVMVSGYNQWLDHNNTTSGSYIDKEIEMEMNSCQLASRLVAQVQSE
jgi:hypothetical protein